MIVRYLRDIENVPVACVVAIAPNQVGYSICRDDESFNKKEAKIRAAGVAATGYLPDMPNRKIVVDVQNNKIVKSSLAGELNDLVDYVSSLSKTVKWN